ncbi:hypothetical protein O0I10_007885 [Lichtheimia ornata]|uniref:Uncharacterized protein n=1 Tax=Lichtheimia ornata TaxID=688661 RepID=A0AAD7V266_9FUNG|nr:uncharacterized protein O0I10_007885 [Lichtheimia ornata]KAJ8656321.1 hypothetical protein O0I10_007885 [Lichtheimia ornata]
MPATCELCGSWLPDHQASCPRNGVHPSQWTCLADPLYQAVNIDNAIIMTHDDEDDYDTICGPSTITQRLHHQDTLRFRLPPTDHY